MGANINKFEPLITLLQSQYSLMIVMDWSKEKKTSSGAWIIANMNGNHIIERTNPDFKNIENIRSHRGQGRDLWITISINVLKIIL